MQNNNLSQDIIFRLPHRYPFLLIDRVTSVNSDEQSISGIKNITVNEPQFTGHFPGKPIMPGVLLIESMAQLAGAYVLCTNDELDDIDVLLASIEEAKFRKPVIPGDTVHIFARSTYRKSNIWKFSAFCTVNDVKVAESKFTSYCLEKSNSKK